MAFLRALSLDAQLAIKRVALPPFVREHQRPLFNILVKGPYATGHPSLMLDFLVKNMQGLKSLTFDTSNYKRTSILSLSVKDAFSFIMFDDREMLLKAFADGSLDVEEMRFAHSSPWDWEHPVPITRRASGWEDLGPDNDKDRHLEHEIIELVIRYLIAAMEMRNRLNESKPTD